MIREHASLFFRRNGLAILQAQNQVTFSIVPSISHFQGVMPHFFGRRSDQTIMNTPNGS